MNKIETTVNLFQVLKAWLDGQQNRDDVVNAALIEYRANHRIPKEAESCGAILNKGSRA